MNPVLSDVPMHSRSAGRRLCALAILVVIGGMVAYGVQIAMKRLTTPWYTPILGTIGVVLMFVGFTKRPTFSRGIGVVLIAAFCAFEWYFLGVLARVPAYVGDAKPGQPVPTFSTTLADGRSLSDADLRDGKSTVLLFFRGRW